MTFRRRKGIAVASILWIVAGCNPSPSTHSDPLETARSLAGSGQWQALFEELSPRTEELVDSSEFWTLYAEACQQLGRTPRGLRAARTAIELAPHEARPYRILAALERDRSRPADALAAIESAIERDEDQIEYRIFHGTLCLESSRVDEAIATLERAVVSDPDHAGAAGALGRALVLGGRYQEAKPHLDRYLRDFPRDPLALYARGRVHLRRGDLTSAEMDLRAAISRAPHLPGPYHNLGIILMRTDRSEEAASVRETHREVTERDRQIRAAQLVVAGAPNDAEAKRKLVQLLREAGRHDEANALGH